MTRTTTPSTTATEPLLSSYQTHENASLGQQQKETRTEGVFAEILGVLVET